MIKIEMSEYRAGKLKFSRFVVMDGIFGTRIKGAKFGYCPSVNEISIELDKEQTLQLIEELQKSLKEKTND